MLLQLIHLSWKQSSEEDMSKTGIKKGGIIIMKLNPFSCLQLYDLCLKRGFNSMDSYLMLKEESSLLIHAYEIMASSRKYSEQQLEYISTILTVKTMYDNMVSSGSLVSPYTNEDKKRLTIVTIEEESDNPLVRVI